MDFEAHPRLMRIGELARILFGNLIHSFLGEKQIPINSGNIDVSIKTDEERLRIIEDANGLFAQAAQFRTAGVEFQQGFDYERLCQYKVWACGNFYLDGVGVPITVARIEEYYRKREGSDRPEQVLFYVLTTRQGLSALVLPELGHLRWEIENNGFKSLNTVAHTAARLHARCA